MSSSTYVVNITSWLNTSPTDSRLLKQIENYPNNSLYTNITYSLQATSPPISKPYVFITPKVGQHSVYVASFTSAGFTSTATTTMDITAVYPDGSYAYVNNAAGDLSINLGGRTLVIPKDSNVANNVGQDVTISSTSGGTPYTCLANPHGYGAPTSLNIGQTWAFSYSVNCFFTAANGTTSTNSPISPWSDVGTYLGTETISVPAGTFLAHKFTSTQTFDPGVASFFIQSTIWLNASSTDSRMLQRTSVFTNFLNPPETYKLQSYN